MLTHLLLPLWAVPWPSFPAAICTVTKDLCPRSSLGYLEAQVLLCQWDVTEVQQQGLKRAV